MAVAGLKQDDDRYTDPLWHLMHSPECSGNLAVRIRGAWWVCRDTCRALHSFAGEPRCSLVGLGLAPEPLLRARLCWRQSRDGAPRCSLDRKLTREAGAAVGMVCGGLGPCSACHREPRMFLNRIVRF